MRTLLTAAVAVLVTALLFLLMQALIRDDAATVVESPTALPVDVVDVPVEKPPTTAPVETPPIEKPPTGVPTEPVLVKTPHPVIPFNNPTPVGPDADGGFKVSLSEGNDPIPVVTIAPQYPRGQLVAGTEGWVRVAFTIAPDGSVADASVVDAHPRRGLFDHAALAAIRHWQFRPRHGDDGAPVASRAEYTIEFKLDGGA